MEKTLESRADTEGRWDLSKLGEQSMYLCCFTRGVFSTEGETGIDGRKNVTLLRFRELSAMVSLVSPEEFSPENLDRNLKDLTWLTPRAKCHQELIRTAMRWNPVIPVKFGTIFTSRDRILAIMEAEYARFQSFFEFVHGKEEWGLKVFVDEEAFGKLAPELRATTEGLERELTGASTGLAFFLKKKGEALLREKTNCCLDQHADRIFAKMSEQAVDSQRNRLFSSAATGKSQRLILNAAFLIQQAFSPDTAAGACFQVTSAKAGSQVAAAEAGAQVASAEAGSQVAAVDPCSSVLQKTVNALGREFGNIGFTFEVTGPWPPFNFCPKLSCPPDER